MAAERQPGMCRLCGHPLQIADARYRDPVHRNGCPKNPPRQPAPAPAPLLTLGRQPASHRWASHPSEHPDAPTPACRGYNTSLWFNDTHVPGWQRDRDQAVAICGTCPLQTACREWAVPKADLHGIWGGWPASKRETERQRRRQAADQRSN